MIRIPHPRHRRALMVIDVVPTFLTRNTRHVVAQIAALISAGEYSHILFAEHTKGRMRSRALANRPRQRSDETIAQLTRLADPARSQVVVKQTRSAFGNDNDVARELRRRRISDVHVVGIETHDCVLATAFDAFDYGFTTCVLERATAAKRRSDYTAGLRILRRVHLTDRTMRV